MFVDVPIWGVVLAAVSAMVVGTVWYSPDVFGDMWMKLAGIKEAEMKKKMMAAMPVLVVVSLITAYSMALLLSYFHTAVGGTWMMDGFKVAVFAWLGFATTTIFAHGVFEPRDKQLTINGEVRARGG